MGEGVFPNTLSLIIEKLRVYIIYYRLATLKGTVEAQGESGASGNS